MTEEQKEEYFENSEVNQKLLKLFESKWDIVHKVCNAITNNDLWLVFHTLCIPYNYEKMKYKILIVGRKIMAGDLRMMQDFQCLTLWIF